MANLEDVARIAGVSISTVSRAINRPDMVNDETRARIEEVIQELNYQPDRVASRLRNQNGSAQVLGLIIPDIQNPFYSEIARGVENVAYGYDHAVILCNSDEDPEREQFYLDILRGERVSGIILPPSPQAQATSELSPALVDLPVVCFDRRLPDDPLDTVVVDNVTGAKAAVQHLVDLGHRRIGLVGGPAISTSMERAQGYRSVLEAHSIGFDPTLVYEGRSNRQTGYQAVTYFAGLGRETPTALFAVNNQLALGVLEALREKEIRVPDQMAVVGFDDAPWGKLLAAPLTAVRQPAYQIGQRAAELLYARIEHPERPPQMVVLDPTLVVRASCGSEARS